MKTYLLNLLLLSVVLLPHSMRAQEQTINTVQPKIIVIPFTKEGEDIRTVLEANPGSRVVITKVKEAFDKRGFTTVDFTAKLKSMKDNSVFTSDNQTDIKSQIVQMSGADIFVVPEIVVSKSNTGMEVSVTLTGYDVSTGNSLSNKVGVSGRFFTEDTIRLASKAIDNITEDFLNTMQTKFDDMVKNGKSVMVDISFDAASQYKFSSEGINNKDLPLSDQIEDWMAQHAYKSNYHLQGTTDLKMIFDDVHIPIKDDHGMNYTASKFSREIYTYFKGLGLQTGKDVKGNTIYITIK